VYIAELKPRSGAEMGKTRPVIIITNDGFNTTPNWRSIIVIPISTSEAQSKRGPTVVSLPKGEGGLDRNSIAVCHQITTLDRQKIKQYLGKLSKVYLDDVEEGIKAAIDI
jgi:mRNA interferase MazF